MEDSKLISHCFLCGTDKPSIVSFGDNNLLTCRDFCFFFGVILKGSKWNGRSTVSQIEHCIVVEQLRARFMDDPVVERTALLRLLVEGTVSGPCYSDRGSL